ncbi:hypothetical protein AB1Y20_016655 [Prymnesium parvum]|uniref:J domain-containing protein n=1 Tax=Prymnesium parvum TaxID=97485 RepID=A0AB34ID27_PRYPA
MADLYDVLGLTPEASDDDIKHAYRRLSMTFHPDRRLDPTEKRNASAQWLHISAAYDVLSDRSKRMIYDEVGAEHMEQALALTKGKQLTAEQLRTAWRKAQARAEERELSSRMKLHGSLVFSVDGTELLQPIDSSASILQRLPTHVSSIAVNEEMALKLDRRNTLSLSNQIVTKSGLGGGTLRIGFGRQLSAVSSLQLGGSFDHGLALSLSRRISRHSRAMVSANFARLHSAPSISMSGTRQLTKRLLGEMILNLSATDDTALTFRLQRVLGGGLPKATDSSADDLPADPPVLPRALHSALLRVRRAIASVVAHIRQRMRSRLTRGGAEVALQPRNVRCGGTLVWRHSSRSRSKLALRFGPSGPFCMLSTERIISSSSNSAFGAALQYSSRGVLLKLRLQRYGQRLIVPIFLAVSPSPLQLLCASGLPALAGSAIRRGVIDRLRQRRRLREAAEKAREEDAASASVASALRQAELDAQLLHRDATHRAHEESSRAGLVVVAAFYGDVQAAVEAYTSAGERAREGSAWSCGPGWIDVRVPLQYIVSDSKLRLPAKSKRCLRGFADPLAAEASKQTAEQASRPPCQLWIRYELRREMHTLVVSDEDPVEIQ